MSGSETSESRESHTDFLQQAGIFLPGSESEESYRLWAEALVDNIPEKANRYSQTAGLIFWLILRFPKFNFSECLDFNEELACWFPKEGRGELWGIATSKKQVASLIEPKQDDLTDPKRKYVYLTFMIRLKQREDWVDLLKFFGDRKMIEMEPDT